MKSFCAKTTYPTNERKEYGGGAAAMITRTQTKPLNPNRISLQTCSKQTPLVFYLEPRQQTAAHGDGGGDTVSETRVKKALDSVLEHV